MSENSNEMEYDLRKLRIYLRCPQGEEWGRYASKALGGLVKKQIVGFISRVSVLVGLGGSLGLKNLHFQISR